MDTTVQTPLHTARRNSSAYDRMFGELNSQFLSFFDRVGELKEQRKTMENSTFIAHMNALEVNFSELQSLYEHKLQELSSKLEDVSAERNSLQMESSKAKALAEEYEKKYKDEALCRKKTENALADNYRVICEKDALIQELRITIAQLQNNLMEVEKERDELLSNYTQAQSSYEEEAKGRKDAENRYDAIKGEMEFQQKKHEQELTEARNRIVALEKQVEIADDEKKKQDVVNDNIATMLTNVTMKSESEIRQYQQEADSNMQLMLQEFTHQHETETSRRKQAEEETIQAKSQIEELQAQLAKLDARAKSIEDNNQALIQTLQIERQENKNLVHDLESKLYDLKQKLHESRNELTATESWMIPINTDIAAFSNILSAADKKMNILLQPQPHDLVLNSNGELVNSRTPFSARHSLPNSPRRASNAGTPRSKSNCGDEVVLPPLKNAPSSPLSNGAVSGRNNAHVGNIILSDICTSGRYVSIYNMSPTDEENIGGYIIQQNVNGRPVTLFRFPPKTIIKANSLITVWAACSGVEHDPPYHFVWKGRDKWESSSNCVTILCKPNGKAVSWTTTSSIMNRNNITVEEQPETYTPAKINLVDFLSNIEKLPKKTHYTRCKSAYVLPSHKTRSDQLDNSPNSKTVESDSRYPIYDYRTMTPNFNTKVSSGGRKIYSAPSSMKRSIIIGSSNT